MKCTYTRAHICIQLQEVYVVYLLVTQPLFILKFNQAKQTSILYSYTEFGETPLCAAARSGKEDTLQYLLSDCKLPLTVSKFETEVAMIVLFATAHRLEVFLILY